MNKKGNNYYNEDDLYDDEDYYDDDDDYYEEDYKQEVKKPTQQQPKQQNNQSKNKTPQQQQAKGGATASKSNNNSNSNQTQQQNKNKIEESKPTTSSTITSVAKKKDKELTPDELNLIKYPVINYGLSADDSDKTYISLVVIGHVDSGKSTLIGHLLYQMGLINNKTIQSYSNNFKKTGNKNFHFAWATDEGTDERERGVTVDIAYKSFQTKTKYVLAMDAPGHRDFIPNMITGTSAADAALLVIDSGKGSFNAGFFQNGQTKEHAILAKTLGVKQIIVCVNKLEMWEWSQERFDYIEAQIKGFLLSIDFKENDIFFLPISALQGDNILKPIADVKGSWYKGLSLIDTIDKLEAPIRAIDGPVRFIISDAISSSINGLQGRVLFGKLECGVITEKTEYEIVPLGLRTKIRSMAVDKQKTDRVIAGQTAELLLSIDKNSPEEIIQGYVLSSVEHIIPSVFGIQAQIKTLDIKTPLTIGQKMFIHIQGQKVQTTLKKVIKIFNDDNSVSKNNPIFIPKKFYAIVNLECDLKICVEIYNNIKQLGRIALRGEGETLAVGIVQKFI